MNFPFFPLTYVDNTSLFSKLMMKMELQTSDNWSKLLRSAAIAMNSTKKILQG